MPGWLIPLWGKYLSRQPEYGRSNRSHLGNECESHLRPRKPGKQTGADLYLPSSRLALAWRLNAMPAVAPFSLPNPLRPDGPHLRHIQPNR
ncbi:hypothetical protein GCM10012275_50420 [Longimycelium tulufanense]|uniref:Uncharacterized protein n=1 Tax=Longimycelium tulufanense TaxID=907463 RepID=A0A8J3CCH7_9PSEU|nr:hypothetical protein GCM10012275_50420 [Longimycelium tulufanense]